MVWKTPLSTIHLIHLGFLIILDIKRMLNVIIVLQEHEVEKMFTLKSGRLPSADVKNIIFFVRPRLELMDIIAENVFRSVLYVSVFKLHCVKSDDGVFSV